MLLTIPRPALRPNLSQL